MPEVWLHNNRRLMLPLLIPAGLMLVSGCAIFAIGLAFSGWWQWIGVALAGIALLYAVMGYLYLRQPRLSTDREHLRIHVGWNRYVAVPLPIVEVFFMGQASSLVRGVDGKEAETATVVVRLADKAKQWHNRDIPAYLGQWCDGYVIIRGTWCEPIDMKLLDRLNGNLRKAHRQLRETEQAKA